MGFRADMNHNPPLDGQPDETGEGSNTVLDYFYPGSVLITFDDAYEDFAQHAWPTLKRLRLGADHRVAMNREAYRQVFLWISSA